MRCFDFKAKSIGDSERYLTYVMGDGVELDEDTLDILEDNNIDELVKVIFEEDDDFDYLTYDVSGKTNLHAFTENGVSKEVVLKLLRNISLSIIGLKERAIKLSYLVLNKGFMFVDENNYDVSFICVPVESEAFVMKEFKSFVKYFMAGLKYNVEEEISYVGQILTYVNGDAFNLRGLIGLTEALMDDAGIDYTQTSDAIATDEGTEVLDSFAAEAVGVKDFMKDLGGDTELPEIKAEEDDDEMDAIEAAADMAEAAPAPKIEEAEEAPAAEKETPAPEVKAVPETKADDVLNIEIDEEGQTDTDMTDFSLDDASKVDDVPGAEIEEMSDEELAARVKQLVNGIVDESVRYDEPEPEAEAPKAPNAVTKPTTMKKNGSVKVSRAAIIQQAAHEAEEAEENMPTPSESVTEISSESKAEKKKNIFETATAALSGVTGVGAADKNQDKAKQDKAATENLKPEPPKNDKTGTLMKSNPYIVRVDNGEKVIIQKQVFKIGKASRGVDYHVSDNGAISRQHAIITKKEDGYYIKDNKSTNHTYVDGRELGEGEEVLLKNNSKFKLADEEFQFKW
ncbi:MAG: FHA domain-containing protein [Eubacterium sp.]|nr:FHA domain-containing protein [Eubacterium sp.]